MDPKEHSEIKSWLDGYTGNLDAVDFLTDNCTIGMWLAFSHFMNPEFVVVRDCVLRKRVYKPSNFEEWYTKLNGDVPRIEDLLNRLVLGYAIDCTDSAEDEAALQDIAQAVAHSWEAALARNFPSRSFQVQVLTTYDGPTVVFSQTPTGRP
ncbi:hypothetical protein [Streptomyces varsoviensis]|uniref:Uncharacterized protein n=1 Tax=Streptomyces varsoviensis TaxID=67373 RepID=A0ABR5J3B5_9ACTN|nr:hypothetical protein [Streptomyces varsoviensis]KOG87626.1 hypothetical protein ADK38_24375 [Streptomyces varsoviensis]